MQCLPSFRDTWYYLFQVNRVFYASFPFLFRTVWFKLSHILLHLWVVGFCCSFILFYFILYVFFTFYICPEYSHKFWVALWDIWIKCFLIWKHGHFFFLLHLSSFSHASVHASLTLPFIILALICSIDFKNQKFSCLKVVISLRYWKWVL